jgi:hypothetical protein
MDSRGLRCASLSLSAGKEDVKVFEVDRGRCWYLEVYVYMYIIVLSS